jgi:hypothetical protein
MHTLKPGEKREKKTKKTFHIEEFDGSQSESFNAISTSSQAALSYNREDVNKLGKIRHRNTNKPIPIIDEPKSDIISESIVFEEEKEPEKTEASNKTDDSAKTKKKLKTSDSSDESHGRHGIHERDSSSSSSNGGNKFFQSHEKSNLSSFSSIQSKLTQSQHVSCVSSTHSKSHMNALKCDRKKSGQTSNKPNSHREQELIKPNSHQQELLVVYIQMRLCDFTLKYWLKHRNEQIFASKAHLDESMCASLFRQIVCGVEYLHSKSIIHRDLKV